MSNALAIATVTATLAQAVRSAAEKAVGGADVVIGRPETPPGSGSRKVHVYLYQVAPNAAQRNADLPSRDATGSVTQRPQVALDLNYLLAFYGKETDLEPQRMLGAVVRDLHARPVLSRQSIRDVVAGEPILADSNLAEAIDLVRITPVPLNVEEFSKLWSVFVQTPHTVSIAYQASTVLIEGEEVAQSAPPVLQRGEDDRGIETLLGSFPTLDNIHIGTTEDETLRPRPPSYPAAQLGSMLFFRGHHLSGEGAHLRLTHTRLDVSWELPVLADRATHTELMASLPDSAQAQAEWAAGIYTVTAVIGRPGSREAQASNALTLTLAPRILSIEPMKGKRDSKSKITLTITCSPQARLEQRVALLLAGREIAAQPRTAASKPLQFLVEDAPVGQDLLLRLRVDGADSLPFTRMDVPPRFAFDDTQRVTIA